MTDDESRKWYSRLVELLPMQTIMGRRVLILGAGAMGQRVAVHLVRHGVGVGEGGCIYIFDGKTVDVGILIRTEFFYDHIGKPKADSTAKLLRSINPWANVHPCDKPLTSDDVPTIIHVAQQCDLLCLFIDDFALEMEISERCRDMCPQVMAVFGPGCDTAEVAYSIPGRTLPLSQTMGMRQRERIDQAQALGTDTACVASFVATLCLQLLAGELSPDLVTLFRNAPLLMIKNRAAPPFDHDPPDLIRAIYAVGDRRDIH